jgi:hypothetical protein
VVLTNSDNHYIYPTAVKKQSVKMRGHIVARGFTKPHQRLIDLLLEGEREGRKRSDKTNTQTLLLYQSVHIQTEKTYVPLVHQEMPYHFMEPKSSLPFSELFGIHQHSHAQHKQRQAVTYTQLSILHLVHFLMVVLLA